MFTSPPVKVRDLRVFGKGHVKLSLMDQGSSTIPPGQGLEDGRAHAPEPARPDHPRGLQPKIDRYQGTASIELLIKDWRTA